MADILAFGLPGLRRLSTKSRASRLDARKRAVAPVVEALESWLLLSTVTVTASGDTPNYPANVTISQLAASPAVTLRDAINATNNTPGADIINFTPNLNGSTITLAGTELDITDNLTINGPGAALLSISGNDASTVLGIHVGATVTLSGLTITDGFALGIGPGGIDNAGVLSVVACAVTENSGHSGGINNAGILTLVDSTISGNRSPGDAGGGIENYGGSVLTATNCTISGNSGGYAGGLYMGGGQNTDNEAASATLTNCTIYGNTGGGIGEPDYDERQNVSNVVILNNTIVAGNTGTDDGIPDGIPDDIHLPVTGSDNLVGDAASSGFLINGVNGNIVSVNPKLGPLANNGGPTETMALLAGSPAINAGSNALAIDANGKTLASDQRGTGFPRISGAAVNIGAYETQSLSLVVDNTADIDNGNYSAGHMTLREAIDLTNENPGGSNTINFGPSLDGSTITLGGTELDITGSLTINGPGAGLLTISGNGASRVLEIGVRGSSGPTVALTGLTITGGNASGNESDSGDRGGGIISDGNLTITDSTITGNTAPDYGGGIYSGQDFPEAHLTITDSTITGNSSREGGGIAGYYVTVQDCTITENTGGNGNDGGGIWAQDLDMTNSTVSENRAGRGGGSAY